MFFVCDSNPNSELSVDDVVTGCGCLRAKIAQAPQIFEHLGYHSIVGDVLPANSSGLFSVPVTLRRESKSVVAINVKGVAETAIVAPKNLTLNRIEGPSPWTHFADLALVTSFADVDLSKVELCVSDKSVETKLETVDTARDRVNCKLYVDCSDNSRRSKGEWISLTAKYFDRGQSRISSLPMELLFLDGIRPIPSVLRIKPGQFIEGHWEGKVVLFGPSSQSLDSDSIVATLSLEVPNSIDSQKKVEILGYEKTGPQSGCLRFRVPETELRQAAVARQPCILAINRGQERVVSVEIVCSFE